MRYKGKYLVFLNNYAAYNTDNRQKVKHMEVKYNIYNTDQAEQADQISNTVYTVEILSPNIFTKSSNQKISGEISANYWSLNHLSLAIATSYSINF